MHSMVSGKLRYNLEKNRDYFCADTYEESRLRLTESESKRYETDEKKKERKS